MKKGCLKQGAIQESSASLKVEDTSGRCFYSRGNIDGEIQGETE